MWYNRYYIFKTSSGSIGYQYNVGKECDPKPIGFLTDPYILIVRSKIPFTILKNQ